MTKQNPGETPRAQVREIDGRLVLDDPVGLAMARAIEKINCGNTLELNQDRVAHFKQRVAERGLTADEVVVIIANVDDGNGSVLADALMPGYDWQAIRDQGEVPFARGLADREFIQHGLTLMDEAAADKLREATELSVVVVDHGVAEIYPA